MDNTVNKYMFDRGWNEAITHIARLLELKKLTPQEVREFLVDDERQHKDPGEAAAFLCAGAHDPWNAS